MLPCCCCCHRRVKKNARSAISLIKHIIQISSVYHSCLSDWSLVACSFIQIKNILKNCRNPRHNDLLQCKLKDILWQFISKAWTVWNSKFILVIVLVGMLPFFFIYFIPRLAEQTINIRRKVPLDFFNTESYYIKHSCNVGTAVTKSLMRSEKFSKLDGNISYY